MSSDTQHRSEQDKLFLTDHDIKAFVLREIASSFTQGALTGKIDGNNRTFKFDKKFIPESLFLFVNGIYQSLGDDYSVNDDFTITFTIAPPLESYVRCKYIENKQ